MIGGGLLLLAVLGSLLGAPGALVTGTHLLVVALAGVPVLISGWRELIFSRSITINLLMSIAAVGAIIIGETGEAATVIVLFALGEALEGYTADRARYSIRALLALAVVLVDGEEATVKRFYQEGGRVRLRPSNPAMEEIVLDAGRVEVRGVVVGLLRRYSGA